MGKRERNNSRSFFFPTLSPSSSPGRFLENGKTELMAADGFLVDPAIKLLNSIGGGRFIVASKRITNVDADETARK